MHLRLCFSLAVVDTLTVLQLQLCIVSVDPKAVKKRHGNANAMITKWSSWLAQAGLRGRHVTFEALGEKEVRCCALLCVLLEASSDTS